jgi:hypothetical protein
MMANSNKEKKENVLCIGLDIGTMNLACARSDSAEIKLMRNVFLPVEKETVSISELTDINYVQSKDSNDLFIIGEDAFRFANLFGKEVSRPMQKGLISPKEMSAIDVLSLMVRTLIGTVKDKETYCSYSIPAEAIDEGRSVTYHEKVFSRILGEIGVNHKPVNEGMAIIYSECDKEKFSGVGISFGAGMCNVCIAYKGIEVAKFSTARSGDWIDRSVSESLDVVANRVTSIKEKHLNLETGFSAIQDKKTQRIVEAIEYYYSALVNYTVREIINEFKRQVDIDVEESLPIVISGGTSLPKGFLNLFKSILAKYNLPFKLSEVRSAKNPLTSVAQGLLIKTIVDTKTA